MSRVSATLDDRQAQALLARLVSLLNAPRAPLTQAGQVAARLVRQTFQDQRDPWGRAWRPWAESTRKARRNASGGNILLRTFNLFRSIDYRPATADGVEVFADAEYASYHQFGNPAQRAWGGKVSPLPQRAFFPIRALGVAEIPARWWLEILKPIEDAIDREARA